MGKKRTTEIAERSAQLAADLTVIAGRRLTASIKAARENRTSLAAGLLFDADRLTEAARALTAILIVREEV